MQSVGKKEISENDEDVHSFLEKHLTGTLGELGKRIHTMRSRNDLILADTRLWGKENLILIAEKDEAWLLDVSIPHSVTSTQSSVNRIAVCLQSKKHGS